MQAHFFCSTPCSRFVLAAYSIHVLSETFFLFLLHAPRYARCARRTLVVAAPPCSIHVLSRFALVLPLRACAGRLLRPGCALRATRTPTPITCADCPNEYLYQFGSISVQSFGRQRWICSLSVYTRLCTHTRARAGTHTHSNKPILNTAR
jgi:hypothetical protein